MNKVILLLISCAILEKVYSDCCYPTYVTEYGNTYKRCGDGTDATPCCGYGGCNVFCCNCDGGCRAGRKRSADSEIESDGFQRIDQDGDGQVSLREARNHIASGACGNATEKLPGIDNHFARMDRNADGFLSHEEINSGSK